MRDIGIFTTKAASTAKLNEFVRDFSVRAGRKYVNANGESVIGQIPDVVYVADSTAPSNGYFSQAEKEAIERELGGPIESYISIHCTSTDTAFILANDLANEIKREWGGLLDYGGSGGSLGVPPSVNRG